VPPSAAVRSPICRYKLTKDTSLERFRMIQRNRSKYVNDFHAQIRNSQGMRMGAESTSIRTKFPFVM
jgi:hypothetical protein